MREISDKVADQVYQITKLYDEPPENNMVLIENPVEISTEIIKQYLTECWQVFDAFNTDTWPKNHLQKEYLLKIKGEGDVVYYKIGKWHNKDRWFQVDFRQVMPMAYLDIAADILPEGM